MAADASKTTRSKGTINTGAPGSVAKGVATILQIYVFPDLVAAGNTDGDVVGRNKDVGWRTSDELRTAGRIDEASVGVPQ